MVPAWVEAGRKVRKIVTNRYVPLVAISAAFAFLIQMFNLPIPGGTTAHAVGAVLIAVVLGPWAAVIAVSIGLLIQALFFGDGGVLAYGANAFNMAFLMPFAGYGVYRLLSRGASLTSGRRALAAGVGGYVGINVAGLSTAVMLGIQPTLFHAANGTPLYSPFHLAQTIPAVMLAHLTIAGVAEFAVTAGVVAYLQRANLPILQINHKEVAVSDAELATRRNLGWRWALVGLGVMILLSPLGLLAPGGAYGEDAPQDLDLGKLGLKAIPEGLQRWNSFWNHTVLGGYGTGSGDHPVLGYILSAVVGAIVVGLVIALVYGLVRLLRPASGPVTGEDADLNTSATEGTESPPGPERVQDGIPEWLLRPEPGLRASGKTGSRRRRGFLERTLEGGASVLRQAVFGQDMAERDGFLQRLDPRVKIVSMLGLLVVTALVRNVPTLLGLYALTLVLAMLSRIPLGFFVRRVWLFIPIFTGIVVLPATFSFISPGNVVLPLWHWHGQVVGLTSQGLEAASLIVTRVAMSISLVVLLTITTPWNRLLAAMRALFVPRIFVMVIGMAYRYVFLLLNSVTDMYTARKARTVRVSSSKAKGGQRFVAASAGALFGKAHALSEEVHMAMESRGYRGEAKTLSSLRLGALDAGWAVGCLLVAVAVLGGDRLLGR
jgi:cobalt/nickel transport system permease protein